MSASKGQLVGAKNGFWRGKPVVHLLNDRKGGAPWEWPEWARVREFPEVRHAD